MIIQDYLVYPDERQFVVIGQIDRRDIYRDQDAAEAINHALSLLSETGGEVRLMRGRYPTRQPIRIPANTHLTGSGRGTVLEVAGGCAAGILIDSVKGANVSDLTVLASDVSPLEQRAEVGIDVVNAADCQVRSVLAQGFRSYGIRLRDNAILCRITDCSAADNAVSNFRLSHLDQGTFGNWIPNSLLSCTTYGGGKGVEVERCIVLTISGVQVHQCTGPAFHIYGVANATSLVGCRTYQVDGDAVVWEDSHEVSIVGNVFSWHTQAGIVLRRCKWGTITGNNVIDTGSYNPGGPCMDTKFQDLETYPPSFPGIRLEQCRGFTINGNAIFQWPVVPPMTNGIEEDSTSADNLISGNNINFYRGSAVQSEGAASTALPAGNHGYGPASFFHNPPTDGNIPLFMEPDHAIQSFEPHLTRRLIDHGYAL